MTGSYWSDGSWKKQGTALNKMLHCGSRYNGWVAHALKYLPRDIFTRAVTELAIFSTAQRDACRVSRAICEKREIILLSERVLPKKEARVDDPDVQYFIFLVLHEVAHAIRKHRSPLYDQLSENEAFAQETEADDLAFSWFNNHVEQLNNQYLKPLTREKIEKTKSKNKESMNRLYEKD